MPKITVLMDEARRQIDVPAGANLRRALLDAGVSPYAPLTRKANCGGRGLCATCGVRILENAPAPSHWHDRIGQRFGYPRLSCQVTVASDMTVRILTDKIIWGRRESTSL
jgi:ferredoxin